MLTRLFVRLTPLRGVWLALLPAAALLLLLLAFRRWRVLLAFVPVLVGMLFGGFLAWRLGRKVIQPILRLSGLIAQIGRGDLSARAEVLADDPLRDLQLGLNQMAERLELGRDELEQRIAMATSARETRAAMWDAEMVDGDPRRRAA